MGAANRQLRVRTHNRAHRQTFVKWQFHSELRVQGAAGTVTGLLSLVGSLASTARKAVYGEITL